MGNYLKSIKNSFKARKSVGIGCLIPLIIIFILPIIISINNYSPADRGVIFTFSVLTIILIFVVLLINATTLTIKKTEVEIIKIIIAFLKKSELKHDKIQAITEQIFSIYKKEKVDNYVQLFLTTKINTNNASQILSKKKTEVKYYILSVLLDLAADDAILTINEENFINEIRKGLLIHEKTFNYIKNRYLKQGLKEERKIIEEQNRKKAAESFSKLFLPYNAYKILGISPTVTKAQLKKVYRTLAKKYHPDKYHGQSEKIIQKAEDKFQEILEAYEIVKKFSDK